MLPLIVIMVDLLSRQRYDDRAYPVVRDCALTDNERVHNGDVHKDVSKRCPEVIQAVENERVVSTNPAHRQGSSSASSNPVVQDYVVSGVVATVFDPSATEVELRALGRIHIHIVVHDDGVRDGLAHNNASGRSRWPLDIDRVVRNQIQISTCGCGVSDKNRVKGGWTRARDSPRGYHISLYIRSPADPANFNRPLSEVLYVVPGKVCLNLCVRHA